MSDFEVIFFAAVAVFFAYKLWSSFGKTNGDEKTRAAESAAYAEKLRAATLGPKADSKTVLLNPADKPEKEEEIPENIRLDIDNAKKIDPAFTLKKFNEGAHQAFEMVVAAFAQKKHDVLKFLLSEEIYDNFTAEIAKREKDGIEASTSVVAIDSAEVLDVELKGNICQIVVNFVSEQIHFLKDKAGEIIEGSKNRIDRVTDIWTFERNLTSKKPNWVIVGIQNA
jgi:predicted lipid-binding transport protein (Tim44 family)